MISQASSENNICFVLSAAEAPRVVAALRAALEFELMRGSHRRDQAEQQVAIVAAVGDRMRGSAGYRRDRIQRTRQRRDQHHRDLARLVGAEHLARRHRTRGRRGGSCYSSGVSAGGDVVRSRQTPIDEERCHGTGHANREGGAADHSHRCRSVGGEWCADVQRARRAVAAVTAPEDLATPEAFARDPLLVWEWYAWRRERLATAAPTRRTTSSQPGRGGPAAGGHAERRRSAHPRRHTIAGPNPWVHLGALVLGVMCARRDPVARRQRPVREPATAVSALRRDGASRRRLVR